MATIESTINDALANILRKTRHAWRDSRVVTSESSGMLKDSQKRPDILVNEEHAFPVVIETEVLPAVTVETEAKSRLGEKFRFTGQTILSSIALRLPERLREKHGEALQRELKNANDIEMVLYTVENEDTCSRWPRSGWITGDISDLSILVQLASIPSSIIDKAADYLLTGVREIAGLLSQFERDYPGVLQKISRSLCQEDSEQTRRMAGAIMANAFIFQEMLAGGKGELSDVKSIGQLLSSTFGLNKPDILVEWRKILKVNYWPIFDIASRILAVIPIHLSHQIVERLKETAQNLLKIQIIRSHDLTGTIFQRLIADRKFLAAFYTTPASAALLAGLAITPNMLPSEESWGDPEVVKNLRIADFACGTGTLLSTVYQRICQFHEIHGGDARKLHPAMMESALIGCDVLPAATHLTASSLAGAYPTVKYDRSSILTLAYGKQENGAVALGSLNLLDPQGTFASLSITAKILEGTGEAQKETWKSLPHMLFDVVIMNPPFTRATSHEGNRLNVPNPMFAAFGSTPEEQQLMAEATKELTKDTSAHGNAGEASIFLVLGHRKLKIGGKLALVMPLSLMSGTAWEKSRRLLAENYSDLILISIAGKGSSDMSFSADTGMAECLVVGQKSQKSSKRAIFVVLYERPAYPMVGASIAKQIRELIEEGNIRRLEDGPVGGTYLRFGDDVIGKALEAPLPACGGWNLSRITDLSLAQTAYQIKNKKQLWLPTMNKTQTFNIPMTTVSNIGELGPVHRDINGYNPNGDIRGPFDTNPISSNSVPTYPILWAHDAERERTMAFEADREGIPRQGSTPEEQNFIDQKIIKIWETASHCHFNCDFQFNSQSTGMQFTPRKTIGGNAWLSIQLSSVEHEKALVLWGNSSLGLLLRWWHSNRQQSGRGRMGKTALYKLPILDVTALTPEQLDNAVKIFDEMCDKKLLPFHEIDKDPVRKELDERFAREVLGVDESILGEDRPLDILRKKLSREPSIRGTK
jgi:hypothetical protein